MTAPLRILVDCRYVRTDHHDGISRYSARLVEALARRHPVEMLIHDEAQLRMLPDLPWHRISSPTNWREPWVARQVNRLEPDVVFTTLQTMGDSGRRYGFVLTLHDLIYHRHRTPPRGLPAIIRLGWWLYHLTYLPQRLSVGRGDEVVTVSETTKELIARHRLARSPVTVVPNAADPLAAASGPRSAPVARDLVYMGSFMPYKNVETLARALRELPGYRLHLCSRITDADRARLEAIAPEGALVVHDGVSDDEYAELLGGAHALVSASRDEGFGIPLVEAMSLGTPVVVSDIPIFREIGGDAALVAPADDASAFAERLRALEDPAEWEARSAASREQARLFDWDRSAGILLEVLTRVGTASRARRGLPPAD